MTRDIFIYHGNVEASNNELRCFDHLSDVMQQRAAADSRKLNFQVRGTGWYRLTAKTLAGQQSIAQKVHGADSREATLLCKICVAQDETSAS